MSMEAKYRPKKDTVNPCIICGWSEHMQIHQNPSLVGHPSINFHYYISKLKGKNNAT